MSSQEAPAGDSRAPASEHVLQTPAQSSTTDTSEAATLLRAPAAAEPPLGAPPADDATVRGRQARATIEACQRELQQGPKPQRAARLHFECARLCESPLGDLASAAAHYRKAYALMPDHLPSIQGARRALLAQEQHAAALPLFGAEVSVTTDPRRKALVLYEKARVLEDAIGNKREAREAYEAALDLDESNPVLLKAVERAELSAKAWDAIDRTYERTANAITADPRHRAAVIAERARVAEARRKDSAAATELYQAAFDADVKAPSAIAALKRLHYSHQRWRDLVSVLEREAELASDPAVRAMALYRIGRVQLDRLGSVPQATRALERAASHTPDDPLILEELARLYERGERYELLAGVLERSAERLSTAAEKVGVYHRIGQIHEERLKDEVKAIAWYERALACDKGYVPAVQAVSNLYGRREQWAELATVHAGEAEVSLDPERRAAAYARIAALCEQKLNNPEQAAQHHARALGIIPGYQPSFKALARLHARSGKLAELAELYERAVDWAEDQETKIVYLFKIGQLHEDALRAPVQALGAYRRILALDPQHLGALHAVQRAAEAGGCYEELVAALELEAQKVPYKKHKLSLLHRAGEISEIELRDDAAALAFYRKVIDIDKAYAPALSGLGRLYSKNGRWNDLIEIYHAELRAIPKGPLSAALLFTMGELYDERMGRDADALASYRKAIEADPSHQPARSALARKLTERSRWDDLVKLLELELSSQTEPGARARTAFRIGEVYEHRLGAADKALAAYERALAAEPDFRPARDGRVRLLTEAREFKSLVEELEREAHESRDPRLALSALLRQGQIWSDELNEPGRAIACFEAVLERDPAHIDALLALEPMYAERGAWDKLAQVYATEARVLLDAGARVAALRELARLQEDKGVGTPDELKATHMEISRAAPDDVAALTSLERIALETGDAELLARIDAKLAHLVDEAGLAAVYHVRHGEALEERGDPSALDVYRAALGRDPDSMGAAHGIARLAEKSSDPRLLEEAAGWQARTSRDLETASRLLVRAASILTERGDIDAAVRILLHGLQLNPDHGPCATRLRELLLARGDAERAISALTQAANAARSTERIAELWIVIADLYAEQKRDVPAALAALNRAHGLSPGYVPMLMKMGELYARDRQWAKAVERWEQVVAATPAASIKLEAYLRLAAIHHDQLGDAARALTCLAAALAIDPDSRTALERLIELQASGVELDAAAETAAKLVRVAPETNARVHALTRLARLERQRGQHAAAIQAYEQAVALVGVPSAPATELRELAADRARKRDPSGWPRYAAALSRYAEQPRAGGAALAPVYLELSRVLADELGQHEQAIVRLQRGVTSTEESIELLSELATRLLRAGQYQQAIGTLRRILELDVTRVDAWRQLSESFRLLHRPTESTLAIAPLVALDAANDLERVTLTVRPVRPAMALPSSFGPTELQGINLLPPDDPTTRLLVLLSDVLGRLYPPELDRYGLSTRDRIGAKSGHPLRALADRVAGVFGLSEYDLYLPRAHSGVLEVELTDPVSLLVPPYFTTLSEAQQVFSLARIMANVVRRLHAVDRLAPEAIELTLAGAARSVDPSFGAGRGDEELLNAHAKRVVRSLPWLGRGAVDDAARAYAAAPRMGVAAWMLKVKLTAARAAVIVGDDLPGSVQLVRQKERDLPGAQPSALSWGTQLVEEMLRFWASDLSFALRNRLGM